MNMNTVHQFSGVLQSSLPLYPQPLDVLLQAEVTVEARHGVVIDKRASEITTSTDAIVLMKIYSPRLCALQPNPPLLPFSAVLLLEE